MTKAEFLAELRARLQGLDKDDLQRSLDFYAEMIDDRMEDGMTEGEAVANVGDLNQIAPQTGDAPHKEDASVKSAQKTSYALRNPWVVVFLSPFISILWAIVFSVLTAFWCVVVALYAVDVFLWASGVVLHVAGTALFCSGHGGDGLMVFGAGAFLVGFAILWSLGCKYAATGMVKATKWTVWGLIRMIVRKECAA
jgi:uncharacterized membrane protein